MAKMAIDEKSRSHLQLRVSRIKPEDVKKVQDTINDMLKLDMPNDMAGGKEWYVLAKGYPIACVGNYICSVLEPTMAPKGKKYKVSVGKFV